jgi:hypothetical protein
MVALKAKKWAVISAGMNTNLPANPFHLQEMSDPYMPLQILDNKSIQLLEYTASQPTKA